MDKFKVIFLTEAREFLLDLDEKSRLKISFNIDKSKIKNDNELFKKLKDIHIAVLEAAIKDGVEQTKSRQKRANS